MIKTMPIEVGDVVEINNINGDKEKGQVFGVFKNGYHIMTKPFFSSGIKPRYQLNEILSHRRMGEVLVGSINDKQAMDRLYDVVKEVVSWGFHGMPYIGIPMDLAGVALFDKGYEVILDGSIFCKFDAPDYNFENNIIDRIEELLNKRIFSNIVVRICLREMETGAEYNIKISPKLKEE